ncbi:ClpP family protease [Scatolibacter rhodanostii]|uniref:ClpP family protease n=1 Tax=Scatolibacter rhodanostii TaxID=2014781 RepID=UPI000C07CA3B|nr:ATP-dependent Clp protease proteolytic subunit [Scatolibacter rhodanostii]
MNMPAIIKENSTGFLKTTLQDELFLTREMQCFEEITAESVNALILQLQYLSRQNSKKEITLYINSPGGSVSSGLALYDMMKAIPNPIRTVCVGTAASMAAVIFLSGDRREMLKHSQVMLHDPLISEGVGGSALKINSISHNLMKTREIIAEIIAEHTGKTLDEIYKVTANDTFFNAKDAIAFGLADNMIKEMGGY